MHISPDTILTDNFTRPYNWAFSSQRMQQDPRGDPWLE
jgi:hypothetical protein